MWGEILNRYAARGGPGGNLGLPTGDDIPELWWYPYFIPSLVSVLVTIGKGEA